MKNFFALLAACVIQTTASSQHVGSKVSFAAADGKMYTGVITEIQGEKYKIKYHGFNFDAWLKSNQFTVTENPPAITQTPPLPDVNPHPGLPQAVPDSMPQTMPDPSLQTTSQTMPQTMDNSGGKTLTRGDSLKMAINNIKNAFGALNKFFTPKRDTLTIMISDIDYDNVNLSQLRENLKKTKGVKSVTMHYKSSTAIMEISAKGKVTDIWDNLPSYIKSAFKLLEAGDNNIILKQKYTP